MLFFEFGDVHGPTSNGQNPSAAIGIAIRRRPLGYGGRGRKSESIANAIPIPIRVSSVSIQQSVTRRRLSAMAGTASRQ